MGLGSPRATLGEPRFSREGFPMRDGIQPQMPSMRSLGQPYLADTAYDERLVFARNRQC
jgi:hypothetical protein